MKETLYVKLYGAPGAGKSTGAAWIFSTLKLNNIDSEYVQEFAKDMVWEKNQFMFEDPDNQLILLASQFYRLNRLRGKVDVVVTDSPLLLSQLYVKNSLLDCNEYRSLVKKLDEKFQGMNVLVKRAKAYNPNGRNQTETESDNLAKSLEDFLVKESQDFLVINGDYEGYKKAYDHVMEKLGRGLTY
jgi:adenylate kinase family enzyme